MDWEAKLVPKSSQKQKKIIPKSDLGIDWDQADVPRKSAPYEIKQKSTK